MLSALLLSSVTWAQPIALIPQPEPRPDATLRVLWDNDGAIYDPTDGYDRHYTNGTSIALISRSDLGKGLWLDFSDPWLEGGTQRFNAGLELGQLMYTPKDIESKVPDVNDVPFTGYVFVGGLIQRETLSQELSVLEQVQLDVGMVGPSSRAFETQRFVHKNFVGKPNGGWESRQTQDEPTLQLNLKRVWRIPLSGSSNAWSWQLLPDTSLALGSVYRHAEAGTTLRFGWQLNDDFGAPNIGNPGTPLLFDGKSHFELYGRIAGRAIEHNLFLEGNTWKDNPLVQIDPEPFVAYGSVGIRYIAPLMLGDYEIGQFEVGWRLTWTTDQFEEQTGTNSYGSIVVGGKICW